MTPTVIEDVRSLKEFIGQEVGISEWITITQGRIQQFADATEDRQWIHLDRERAARESPYGTTIAHGFLTLSLVSYLVKQAFQIKGGVRMAVNYGLDRVRFPAPVRSESKIRARVKILTLTELPEVLEITLLVTLESENFEKPCCVAEWVVRYYDL
jgi:acyl dehydratase